jgi:hypothetical protein
VASDAQLANLVSNSRTPVVKRWLWLISARHSGSFEIRLFLHSEVAGSVFPDIEFHACHLSSALRRVERLAHRGDSQNASLLFGDNLRHPQKRLPHSALVLFRNRINDGFDFRFSSQVHENAENEKPMATAAIKN